MFFKPEEANHLPHEFLNHAVNWIYVEKKHCGSNFEFIQIIVYKTDIFNIHFLLCKCVKLTIFNILDICFEICHSYKCILLNNFF